MAHRNGNAYVEDVLASSPQAAMPGSPDSAARVSIQHLSKTFQRAGGSLVHALDDISLAVYAKEIVVLLGPSGCGKSTLLRCIAGLEYPDAGTMSIGDAVVFDSDRDILVPPNERDVNMMFQSYALWPHMTLEDNVGYPLRVAGVRRKRARERANEYLELVGLEGLGKQYAGNVSGGQAQRAALARTLISEPAVVLFDEPLSNVDAKVRSRLRAELLRIHAALGFSAIYVTHDQIEALGIGTRIAVMKDGKLDQVGTPVEIYDRPSTRYAAEFIGEANILEGCVVATQPGGPEIETALGVVVLSADGNGAAPATIGEQVTLMVRPECCRILRQRDASPLQDGPNGWAAVVDTMIYAGSRVEYICKVGDAVVAAWELASAEPVPRGTEVVFHIPPTALRVIRG